MWSAQRAGLGGRRGRGSRPAHLCSRRAGPRTPELRPTNGQSVKNKCSSGSFFLFYIRGLFFFCLFRRYPAEAAALHLWPWGAEEQVTKALPEAGLDQARGTESSGSLPDALEGREGREIGALPAWQRGLGNVEPVFDFRLTLML